MNLIKFFPLLFLISCGEPTETSKTVTFSKYSEYDVIVIDSCEYLVYGRLGTSNAKSNDEISHYNSHTLTHKGNCKNPIHQCK